MDTIAVILVGAAWLGSLLTLGLGLAGVKRWHGPGSRLRSAGMLVMFTGLLTEQFAHRLAAHPLLVLGALLVAAGVTCVFVAEAKARSAGKPASSR